jgi:glucose-6-phosphate 1-dehydrogenase
LFKYLFIYLHIETNKTIFHHLKNKTNGKQFSDARKRLGNWNGTSRRGQVAYEAMFEAEKAIDNAIFNSHDEYSSFWDGTYSWER